MNGFKIVKADEPIKERPLVLTIFGQPGIGKTSLSFTMPAPVMHLDFDRGFTRAVQSCRPDSAQIDDFGGFYSFLLSDEFSQYVNANGIKSVVIDTAGAMLDDFCAPYLISVDRKNGNASGGLSLQGWGALSILANNVKNRIQSLGVHLMFIAHAKDCGEDAVCRMDLAVKGGTSDIITRVSDQIGFIYAEGKARVLDFAPSQMHLGKDTARIGKVSIPDAESATFTTYMAQIVEVCNNKMFALTQAQQDAKARIAELNNILAKCEKPADFTKFSKGMESDTETIKLQLRKPLQERMAAVGVTFKDKKFVAHEVQD
jgi:hypothetical protein